MDSRPNPWLSRGVAGAVPGEVPDDVALHAGDGIASNPQPDANENVGLSGAGRRPGGAARTGCAAPDEIPRYGMANFRFVVEVNGSHRGRHSRTAGGLVEAVARDGPARVGAREVYAGGIHGVASIKVEHVAVGDGVAAVVLLRGGPATLGENSVGRSTGTVTDVADGDCIVVVAVRPRGAAEDDGAAAKALVFTPRSVR